MLSLLLLLTSVPPACDSAPVGSVVVVASVEGCFGGSSRAVSLAWTAGSGTLQTRDVGIEVHVGDVPLLPHDRRQVLSSLRAALEPPPPTATSMGPFVSTSKVTARVDWKCGNVIGFDTVHGDAAARVFGALASVIALAPQERKFVPHAVVQGGPAVVVNGAGPAPQPTWRVSRGK